MKTRIRILLIITVISLISVFPGIAAYADAAPSISIASEMAAAGDTVTVAFTLENNPGIAGLTLNIEYDSNRLSIESTDSVKEGTTALNKLWFIGIDEIPVPKSGLCEFFVSWFQMNNDDSNGVILTVTFKVLDAAGIGPADIKASIEEVVNSSQKNLKDDFSPIADKVVTVQRNLKSILPPDSIAGIKNGTALANIALPATVTLDLGDDVKLPADVTWNRDAVTLSQYNPALKTAQTFTINGIVALPENVLQNKVPLTASISVTVDGAAQEQIFTISSVVSKIVAGCAANIPVEVTFLGDVVPLSLELRGPDGELIASLPVSGNGKYVFALSVADTAAAGLYTITAVGAEKDVVIDCVVPPKDLWVPVYTFADNTLTVVFASDVSFNEGRKGVSVNGAAVLNGNVTAQGSTIVIKDVAPTPGNTVVISGVKYASLFPSYSFTFTIQIK